MARPEDGRRSGTGRPRQQNGGNGSSGGFRELFDADFTGLADDTLAAGDTIEAGGYTWRWGANGSATVATTSADGLTLTTSGTIHTSWFDTDLEAVIPLLAERQRGQIYLLATFGLLNMGTGNGALCLVGLNKTTTSAIQRSISAGIQRTTAVQTYLRTRTDGGSLITNGGGTVFTPGADGYVVGGAYSQTLGQRGIIYPIGASVPADVRDIIGHASNIETQAGGVPTPLTEVGGCTRLGCEFVLNSATNTYRLTRLQGWINP